MKGIEIKNLTKQFGNVTALDDVTLQFEDHKIYGLLGRNGAGKSTLLNIISDKIFFEDGEVLFDGKPIRDNQNASDEIFLMSEDNLYPEDIRIKNLFKWISNFKPQFNLDYAMELANAFELNMNAKYKSLSTGYNSICKLVIALSSNARFVFLDEPILGLDANHRDLFYKSLIERYANTESSYILSTHLIEEISNIVEDVIIIKEGMIIFNNTREQFLERAYAAAGTAAEINEFTKNKVLIGSEEIAGLKVVYIEGTRPEKDIPGITISTPDMQKLFIIITNN